MVIQQKYTYTYARTQPPELATNGARGSLFEFWDSRDLFFHPKKQHDNMICTSQ